MRLNVYLQQAGVGSRREAERLLAAGAITINGKPATPITVVNDGDKVQVNGRTVTPASAPLPRVFLYHKPVGVIVTARDHEGRTTLYEALPPGLPRIMPVGRLDLNSEGLLLLSTDGALNQTLMSPTTALEREYRVRVFGELTEAQLNKFRAGVTVKGVAYGSAKVFAEKGTAEGRNRWYKVVLTEGKNREIRKIFQHFGCTVNRLIRVRYGAFKLGALPRGVVAELPPQQVKVLMKNLEKITSRNAKKPALKPAVKRV